jgi:DedD protein
MFFRQRTDSEKRPRARTSNEAQLKELRTKARRRLIGALVLVLAAVIIVPWLFQEPVTDDTHAPVVVPAAPAGLPPAAGAASSSTPGTAPAGNAPAPAEAGAQGTVQPPGSASTTSSDSGSAAPAAAGSTARASGDDLDAAVASVTRTPAKPAAPESRPAEPAKSAEPVKSSTEPAKPAKKPVERTDDGSVALALLAGKTPAKAAPAPSKSAEQGRYFLQVASYSVEQDAQSRRDSLRQAGVTDAYVERGQAAGRTVYRLRVGPFGSREAAQAAQARLRALGYQNGLISAN